MPPTGVIRNNEPSIIRARVRASIASEEATEDKARFAWASARIALGAIFLWAFADKLVGLGYATPPERAWLNGGNPTMGYLSSSTGPFAAFFQAIAGHPVTNALFMLGLVAVGAALLLGIGMRIAAGSGALMVIMMWASHLPPATNPILDSHVVYAIVLVGLALSGAGRAMGFGGWWSSLEVVKKYPALE